MADTPVGIAQLALDAIGINYEIGDLEAGGRYANVTLRAYAECRRRLLRAAPWAFARRNLPLQLLADSSGNTANVSTRSVDPQFIYTYGYIQDCARIRYIPWYPFQYPPVPSGNIVPPNNTASAMANTSAPPYVGMPIRPSKYLVTNDPNEPAAPGSVPIPGTSPSSSTVILSNVQNATCVFTFDALYPNLWDALFHSAMVSYLASETAVALWAEKNIKLGIQLRNEQIAITKGKLLEARVADGNEGTFSSDIQVDWMQARRAGGTWSGWGPYGSPGDWGCWGGGWGGSLSFSDGTSY